MSFLRLSYFFIVICCSIFLAACATGVRYSPGEIKNFPEDIQKHIQAGEIVPGMTQIQVRYAWGAPSDVQVLEPKDGRYREMWIYSTSGLLKTRLIFVDGVLHSIISGDPAIKIE
ncbi:MAG: hypothetical protein N2257_09525 [Thermodesulfovibrionales bacterium]|nr:hypothetical protein [Thermodesulfovibrionales bacterium]